MKENWTYKKLGEVCEILNGFAFKSDEYEKEGIRVMRITNVQKGMIVDDDPKFFPLSRVNEITRFMLREDDVLMSLTGNVGRVGIIEEKFLPAALNQRVACLRLKDEEVDKRFLFHILNSAAFENDCIFNAAGIAQKNMSTKWLEQYKIPIPPLQTQSQIVKELDLLQSIIDKQKAQLKELDNLAQAVFYDMFGDPVENEKGWEVKCLSEMCLVITKGTTPTTLGFPFVDNGINFVKVEAFDDGCIDSTKLSHISNECNQALSRSQLEKEDLLICIAGATIGKMAVVDSSILPANTNQACAIIRLKDKENLKYIQSYLKQKFEIEVMQMGKGVAQPNLSLGQLRSLMIPMPPFSLIKSFAAKIESIEKQKSAIGKSVEETQKLFDYTMDKYFG